MSADHTNRASHPSPTRPGSPLHAFTLLELLLVVTIIGLLASVALPHLTGFGKSNSMIAGTRQLLDDVASARQKAMSTRSPVYMVFLPQNYWNNSTYNASQFALLKGPPYVQATNLLPGQLTAYALYSPRTVGDQPGRSCARYLTSWKTLPKGIFIPVDKFFSSIWITNNFVSCFDYTNTIQFPTIDGGVSFSLPYIAFNSRGEIDSKIAAAADDVIIPLTRGSTMLMPDWNVLVEEVPRGNYTNDYNLIRIDKMTGRAKLERLEIP